MEWSALGGEHYPLPFLLLLGGLLALSLLRLVVRVFLGADAANRVAGNLATDMIRWLFKICFLPFRLIGGVFRQFGRRI